MRKNSLAKDLEKEIGRIEALKEKYGIVQDEDLPKNSITRAIELLNEAIGWLEDLRIDAIIDEVVND